MTWMVTTREYVAPRCEAVGHRVCTGVGLEPGPPGTGAGDGHVTISASDTIATQTEHNLEEGERRGGGGHGEEMEGH